MASLDLVGLWEAHCRYEFETREDLFRAYRERILSPFMQIAGGEATG
jgi:hypothetical protein